MIHGTAGSKKSGGHMPAALVLPEGDLVLRLRFAGAVARRRPAALGAAERVRGVGPPALGGARGAGRLDGPAQDGETYEDREDAGGDHTGVGSEVAVEVGDTRSFTGQTRCQRSSDTDRRSEGVAFSAVSRRAGAAGPPGRGRWSIAECKKYCGCLQRAPRCRAARGSFTGFRTRTCIQPRRRLRTARSYRS